MRSNEVLGFLFLSHEILDIFVCNIHFWTWHTLAKHIASTQCMSWNKHKYSPPKFFYVSKEYRDRIKSTLFVWLSLCLYLNEYYIYRGQIWKVVYWGGLRTEGCLKVKNTIKVKIIRSTSFVFLVSSLQRKYHHLPNK